MAYDLDNKLVVGVSSRALFDLTYENTIFEAEGVEAYCRYQIEHESEILNPGPGFPLVKAFQRDRALRVEYNKGCAGQRCITCAVSVGF